MTGLSGNSAGNFLIGHVPTGVKARDFFDNYIINTTDEVTLCACAREDARRYVYNATVSFVSGIASLQTQHVAWVVTKMYYAAFYIGRAALCRSRHIIFHVPKESGNGHTQYEVKAFVGERATVARRSPSTHKLVAHQFQQIGYPSFMQSLKIDGADPIMWLMDQREYWQYRAGRFPDPDLPSILDKIDPDKVQRHLAEYAADSTGVFLADPDHAVISIPFRLIVWALSVESLLSPGVVDADDVRYLRKRCRIAKQQLSALDCCLPG